MRLVATTGIKCVAVELSADQENSGFLNGCKMTISAVVPPERETTGCAEILRLQQVAENHKAEFDWKAQETQRLNNWTVRLLACVLSVRLDQKRDVPV
jgi:hypothetical protein